MKVLLVEPPITGHKFRGSGVYFENLVKAIKEFRRNFPSESKNLELRIGYLKDTNQNVDLIHFPYFDPFFLTLPLFRNRPTVVTVHDLIPIRFPDNFPRGLRGGVKWQIQKLALKNVQGIITDSFSSKKDINRLIGISEEKIHFVPLAADKDFQKVNDNSYLEKIRAKYKLSKEFVLYVGDLDWNKNIEGLISAFAEIKDLSLILVGKAFADESLAQRKELIELINKLGLDRQIKLLGFVSREDLVALYNLASLYIQPSFYEGFGLPVLEAMACGCPVICANTGSLPEVAGKAAIFFDSFKGGDLEAKIIDFFHDRENNRKNLSEKEREWVKNFSWERTARRTIKVYEKILGF